MLIDNYHKNEKFILSVTFYKKDLPLRFAVLKKLLLNEENELFGVYILGLPNGILVLFETSKTELKFTQNIEQSEKFFIKQFPELVVITDNYADKLEFINSIGNFNEGIIEFYILNKPAEFNELKNQMISFSDTLNYIMQNNKLKIEITADAEVFIFESTSDEIIQNIKQILQNLEK